jgi:hypothetical protein
MKLRVLLFVAMIMGMATLWQAGIYPYVLIADDAVSEARQMILTR